MLRRQSRLPRSLATALTLGLMLLGPAGVRGQGTGDPALLGFTEASGAAQVELETRLDAHMDAENLRAWMRRMTRDGIRQAEGLLTGTRFPVQTRDGG